jgi:hypothetical protein
MEAATSGGMGRGLFACCYHSCPPFSSSVDTSQRAHQCCCAARYSPFYLPGTLMALLSPYVCCEVDMAR